MLSGITLKIAQRSLGSDPLCLTLLREPELPSTVAPLPVKLDAIQSRVRDAIPTRTGGHYKAYNSMRSTCARLQNLLRRWRKNQLKALNHSGGVRGTMA